LLFAVCILHLAFCIFVNKHILICGTSTRAAADSAARAGLRVTAIDAYADLDQHPSVRALSLPRDFGRPATAHAIARAARTLDCDAVAYLSPFENHPRAVHTLAAGRVLWGNPPDVLRRVRDPRQLSDGFRKHGFATPAVRVRPDARFRSNAPNDGNDPNDPNPLNDPNDPNPLNDPNDPNPSNDPNDPNPPNDPNDYWLVKPLRSGGGQHISRWQGGPLRRGRVLQEWIAGVPGSVVFVAAGGEAVPLGVSRQLIGDLTFGSSGFRYCGSIMASGADTQFADGETLVERACALAAAAAVEFGLVGVNAIDFVARAGVPYPIELNPRWSSSMEVVEALFGLPLFQVHAAACDRSELPSFDLTAAMRATTAKGKAILFARDDIVVGETRAWLTDSTVRDVPHPGERIARGQPICTVFADGSAPEECYQALVHRAERVYAEVRPTVSPGLP
jgi:predicted ATP-grasp superfamily ATP-dependent carboligase